MHEFLFSPEVLTPPRLSTGMGKLSHSFSPQKMSEHDLYLRILRDGASLAKFFNIIRFHPSGLKEVLEAETGTHRDAMTGLLKPVGINGIIDGTGLSVSCGLFC